MQDVLIIGGGVVGLSIACELAEQGRQVSVFDRGPLGQEASWAGAGMLPPADPMRAATPLGRLRGASHQLWSEWSERLREQTGIDNGYSRCGGLELRLSGPANALDEEITACSQEGIRAEPVSLDQLSRQEPALTREVAACYHLPDMGQVRNPRHVKALLAACQRLGVKLLPDTPVHRILHQQGQVVAVESAAGKHSAGEYVIAAGAWSTSLTADLVPTVQVRPLRGQMVLLRLPEPPLRQVLTVASRYIVPRADGRVLVGATQEPAGFDKRTTAAAIGELLAFARRMVPALAEATFERCWAGFRPQSADGLPYLGRVPGCRNLSVATGHFRDGLQLSPVTGTVMAQLLLGQPTLLPLTDYAVDRHSQALWPVGAEVE